MSNTRRVRVADERDELGDRARAALLREPDQREQHLGRRLRVRQRAVARLHRRAEEVGELREARARHAAGEQPPRERHRVDDRRRRAATRSGARSRGRGTTRSKRALCATSTASPANARKPLHRGGARRRAPQLPVGEPGQRRDRGRERHVRVDERLELVDDLEAAHLDGADLADLRRAGPQARRLEVDDDVRRVLEQEVGAERAREPDGVAVPREARVGLDDVREERAGERDRAPGAGRRAAAPPPPRRPVRAAPRRAPRAGRRRLASAAWQRA